MGITLQLGKINLSNSATVIEPPKVTHEKHLEYWDKSGVNRAISKLNVFTLTNSQEISKHLNIGDLSDWRRNSQFKGVLKGGWRCGDIFRPDIPRKVRKQIIKYELPRGAEIKSGELILPLEFWKIIAIKFNVSFPEDCSNPWEWVKQNPQIPVAITESPQKAGAIITSQLIPAIYFPGHTSLIIRDNGDVRFAEYLHPNREIYICLDSDLKKSTREGVAKTIWGVIRRSTRDLENFQIVLPQPRAKLKICEWYVDEKGIDDLLMAYGSETVSSIFEQATPYQKWVDRSYSTIGFEPQVKFSSRYFGEHELPDSEKFPLVVLAGGKGTGKTTTLSRWTEQAKVDNRPVVSVVHRQSLAEANAVRLLITYIQEIDGKVSDAKLISLVINSLFKVNPANFAGGLFIMDEFVQVIRYFFTSTTCDGIRDRIMVALKAFAKVVRETNGQMILADADADEATIRFFIGLLGGDIEPYIIQNEYCEPSYDCFISQGLPIKSKTGKTVDYSPIDCIATALSQALTGNRVLVLVTAQKETSKFGSYNLEKMYLQHGITSVFRFDSETTKDSSSVAYRVKKGLLTINEAIDMHQISIISPSGHTGLSIEPELPIDLCVGIFNGLTTTAEVRQALMRLRDKGVPRLIYVSKLGFDTGDLNLGTTAKNVDLKSHDKFEFVRELLDKHDAEWIGEYPEIKHCDQASTYINGFIAQLNKEHYSYKDYVIAGLKQENVRIKEIELANDVFPCTLDYSEVDKLAEDIQDISTTELYRRIENQRIITADEHKSLKEKDALTTKERLSLKAKELSDKYGAILPITSELIEKDANGWFDQLRLEYAATIGNNVINQLQLLAASAQAMHGEGTILTKNFSDSQAILGKAEFIRESGILELLDKDTLSSEDAECVDRFEFLLTQKDNYYLIFNKRLAHKKSADFDITPISIVLKTLGRELVRQRSMVNKKRFYSYSHSPITDKREEIYEAWLKRDTEKATRWLAFKHECDIKRCVAKIPADVDLEYLEGLKTKGLFDEVWERVDTNTRIQIINRAENFTLPTPIKQIIHPSANNYQEILAHIKSWKTISLDIETYGNDGTAKKAAKEGLHPRKGYIRLIQVSDGKTSYCADFGDRNSDRSAIETALADFIKLLGEKLTDVETKIIGQNIHFDLRFLKFKFGFNRARNVIDTIKGAMVFFGDYGGLKVLPGGYGLRNLCEKFLGLEVDKTEQKSDWGQPLTETQIEYALNDPYLTFHLWLRLEDLYKNPQKYGFGKLAQDGIREAWQLENDVIACATEMENNGLPFDKEHAESLLTKCQGIQSDLLKEWESLGIGLNYTQVKKLSVWLAEKYNIEITKLNKTTLADLSEYPEIQLLGKLRSIKIPIQQLESLLRSANDTGRVQTVVNTLTGTGRFSSGQSKIFKDLPNLQSISAKCNPALERFKIPPIRTVITTDRKSEWQYWIIDQKSANSQLKKYQALTCQDEKIKQYVNACIEYLKAIVAIKQDFVKYNDYSLIWEEPDAPDMNLKLSPIVRRLSNRAISIVDLAASHGRIAADVADDETAIAGCNDDSIDNHSKVAVYIAQALGTETTWEEIAKNKKSGDAKLWRDAAKNTYYGWLNGAGAKRIQAQIKANSGQVVALEACEAAIRGCEELYPGVVDFRRTLVDELSNKENLLYVDDRYYAVNKIKSVSNRITHRVAVDGNDVDLPYTQVLAAIWSRTEATALKEALIKITELSESNPEWKLKIINYVHDEINTECNTKYIKESSIAVNNIIGDCFAKTLNKVNDGRETNWTKLIVNNWSEK